MCYSRLTKGGIVIPHLILTQYIITALSSGLNAGYFFRYRSPMKRRRIGALTLALLSLAIFIESLCFSIFSFYQGQEWASAFFLDPSHWLVARLLVCFGSLLISGLILRQLMTNRR